MLHFPKEVAFRHQWRSYQARVLTELASHLEDNHLHVVAAPGSGKTVLGLEVTLRLDQPALIFAPTVAIRDQWVARLVGLFYPPGTETPTWVSKDVRKPGFLTVTTYQGLFSAMTGRETTGRGEKSAKSRLLKSLQAQSVKTLVFDEAHHLRNSWWSCLVELRRCLDAPTIVALTATAPFDVSPPEWDKYIDLCGPIDAEITIPELVKQETLCPHQDLLYLSTPLENERQEIEQLRQALQAYTEGLYQDHALIESLSQHPHVLDPVAHEAIILERPEFYTAIAAFLKRVRKKTPQGLGVKLGLSSKTLPKLGAGWMETLLNGLLFDRAGRFAFPAALRQRIHRDLARLGALERRAVTLEHPQQIGERLVRSVSKLASVEHIVALERSVLGEAMRLVILTDYIRREDFAKKADDLQPLKRLGVVPLFEQLRRRAPAGLRLGILSGSLVVVPREAIGLLREIANEIGVPQPALRTRRLRCDEAYREIKLVGADSTRQVQLLTALFLDAMQQVLGPVDEARYVMMRRSPLRLYFIRDSFQVPEIFAKNKPSAEAFQRTWSRRVGPVELFYTRHDKGRQVLLKAKTHSLYTATSRVTQRVRSWS